MPAHEFFMHVRFTQFFLALQLTGYDPGGKANASQGAVAGT